MALTGKKDEIGEQVIGIDSLVSQAMLDVTSIVSDLCRVAKAKVLEVEKLKREIALLQSKEKKQ